MNEGQIQEALLRRYSIRVGAGTAAYVRDHLLSSHGTGEKMLPIMGRDARTGVSLRTLIAISALVPSAPESVGVAADAGASSGNRT